MHSDREATAAGLRPATGYWKHCVLPMKKCRTHNEAVPRHMLSYGEWRYAILVILLLVLAGVAIAGASDLLRRIAVL